MLYRQYHHSAQGYGFVHTNVCAAVLVVSYVTLKYINLYSYTESVNQSNPFICVLTFFAVF